MTHREHSLSMECCNMLKAIHCGLLEPPVPCRVVGMTYSVRLNHPRQIPFETI